MVNTFPRAPQTAVQCPPANSSPTATKNAASTAARYSTWVKTLLASRRLPWLCKMEVPGAAAHANHQAAAVDEVVNGDGQV